jgi:hypothetical protein
MYFLSTMGRLGTTVTGTDPRSTGGHPHLQQKKRRLQMNKFRFTIKLVVIATFVFAFASIAQAQATRTWVSGVGDDVNPCSRTAPCKTFAGAISKTAAGGEIDCLDPGGFGAVTITKSITIDGTKGAGFGSILASGVSGVQVNDSATASPGTSIVILRNLSINGANTTQGSGIRFLSGKSLTVEDCQIFGFIGAGGAGAAGKGIDVSLTLASKNVAITNTSIQNCTEGIRFTTTSGFVSAQIDNVHIEQPTATASSAIEVATGGIAVIRDSYLANYQTGVNVTGPAASSASAHLVRTTIFNSTTGFAVGNTTSGVGSSSFVNNSTAISLSGGIVKTGCDNFFDGNSTDVNGGALTNACGK